jgi:hypothetical protein
MPDELAEAKVACDGKLPVTYQQTLLDGSRLVVLNLPTQAAFKKLFEIVVCRLVDDHDTVKLSLTYVNGSVTFPSCSTGGDHATGEGALWEAVRRCYHSAW